MGKFLLALVLVVGSCSSTESVVSGGGPADVAGQGDQIPPGDAGDEAAAITRDDVAGPGDVVDEEVLGLRCGSATFAVRSLDLAELSPFLDDLGEFVGAGAAAELDVSSEWIRGLTFYEVERTDESVVVLGVRSGSADGTEPYFDAKFEKRDGSWRASQWGDCWMVTDVDGFEAAELAIDPANEPSQESTSLTLLATERSCTGGRLPEGRDIQPLVVETDTSVQVLVLIEEPTGPQECPGNPAFPITVDLARPLGDRSIIDGASSPPEELEWPLPQQPSQLRIVMLGDAPAPGTVNVMTYGGLDAARLRFHRPVWGTEPGQVINLDPATPRTITAFVAACEVGTCLEQCEEEICDAIERLSTPCEALYEPLDLTQDTIVTITYVGTDCSMDVTSAPIA